MSPEPGDLPNTAAQNARLAALRETGPVGLLRHCFTVGLRIEGGVPAGCLDRALAIVQRRHPALRAAFDPSRDTHTVVADAPIPVRRLIMSGADRASRWQAAVAYARRDGLRAFDVTCAPLVRAALLAVDERLDLLVLTFDQLIVDAWSVAVVLAELVAAADGEAAGRSTIDGSEDAYRELQRERVRWHDTEAGQAARARRTRALGGVSLRLPCPRRPEPPSSSDSDLAHVSLTLPDEIGEAFIARTGPAGRLSFAAAVTAAAAALIPPGDPGRYGISSTFACRETSAENAAVGWLSNNVSLPLPSGDDATVAAYLDQMRRVVFAAVDDQRAAWHPAPPAPPEAGLSVSVLYVPAQISGATQTDMRIGSASVRRIAISVCPTGCDVDLYLIEGPVLEDGAAARLAVGGNSQRRLVGPRQLDAVVRAWADRITALATTDPAATPMSRFRSADLVAP